MAPEATFEESRNQRAPRRSRKRENALPLKSSFCSCRCSQGPERAKQQIVDRKTVELVAVNGEVAAAFKFPLVFFVDFHAYQVGHDLAQSAVMVALHPDHFDAALGIGEFANVAEKLPVRLGQAAKIEVGKNVAQQDQAAETVLPQHPRGLLRRG